MARVRRRFEAGFKAKVALEAVRGLKTVQEIAKQFQVHPNLVTTWRKQLLDGASEIFDGPAAKAAKESEPSSAVLYEQIGRLKVELEWLKKKVAQDSSSALGMD